MLKLLLKVKGGVLTGKKAVSIILLIVGVMLMFFIISQGVSIYKSSREGSDDRSSALSCVGYLYTISSVTATEDELQFEFKNEVSSSEDVHNLTIIGEGQQSSRTVEVSIPSGRSLAVRVPVSVRDNFTVFPDNCKIYAARCNLDGECAYH